MDSNKINNQESNSFDIRCSTSCTRAGTTALILATIAMSLLISYKNLRPFNALAEYVSLRFSLVDNLEIIQEDQCWKDLVQNSGKEPPEHWPIFRLLHYECNRPASEADSLKGKSKVEKKVNPLPSKYKNIGNKLKDDEKRSYAKKDSLPPQAPAFFQARVVTKLTGIETIAKDLVKLFDNQFLSLARSYTHTFDRSIYKWWYYRDRLMSKAGGFPMRGLQWGSTKMEDGEFGFLDKPMSKDEPTTILENLNYQKVKLLAEYELPSSEEFSVLKEKFINVKIPTLGFPMTFYSGSVFIEFALCFVLTYFWLFQRESQISDTYPNPGTLFGVFGRNQLNHTILLVLIAFPPIAAALLAVMSLSLTMMNIIPAGIIIIISTLIAYESRNLSKKSTS